MTNDLTLPELLAAWEYAEDEYQRTRAELREAQRNVTNALRDRNEITGEMLERFPAHLIPEKVL